MSAFENKGSIDREIKKIILNRYERRVMNNIDRAHFVECMIATVLVDGWKHSCIDSKWNQWDCEFDSKARVEIKQSAALQFWEDEGIDPTKTVRFDIAARTSDDESNADQEEIEPDEPRRHADVYIFAWHGEDRMDVCDQCEATQWKFLVAKEEDLPDQKTIGLNPLKNISESCDISNLKATVEKHISEIEVFKAGQ